MAGTVRAFDLYSGNLKAPNRLSLDALVTLDGFKCQCTENELQSAVCHHWLITNSQGGKLQVANSCSFNFCFGCLKGETQLPVVIFLS